MEGHGRILCFAAPLYRTNPALSLCVACHLLDTEQLINDAEVEAVVICSPTDQHAGQIMAAAKAGKMIFCEKPISLSLDIIDEVYTKQRDTAVQRHGALVRRREF